MLAFLLRVGGGGGTSQEGGGDRGRLRGEGKYKPRRGASKNRVLGGECVGGWDSLN